MSKIPVSKNISTLVPYDVPAGAELSYWEKVNYLKLDWNEATYGPSPKVKAKLGKALKKNYLNYYPEVTGTRLREKISGYVKLPKDYIQIFNGSDAALQTICTTYLNNSDSVLIRQPTYTQLNVFAQAVGANLVKFTAKDPFDLAINKYRRYLSEIRPKMVYIVNPNNPTGIIYDLVTIESFLKSYPSSLFVVDEAYFEFSGKTVVSLIPKYENLIVTRSFSKAFALAGLRIGYIMAQPGIIADINRVRNGKDVNVLAQIAAMAALDDLDYMRSNVKKVVSTRTWLVRALKKKGIDAYDGEGNFILIKLENCDKILSLLAKRRILARNRSSLPQLEKCLRVSIGLPKQMKLFLKEFTQVIKK